MPQWNAPRRVKSHQQMIQALELRAAGASFMQIGEGVIRFKASRLLNCTQSLG
jgi:hypothetical protein